MERVKAQGEVVLLLGTHVPECHLLRQSPVSLGQGCWVGRERGAACPPWSAFPDAPTTESSLWTDTGTKGSGGSQGRATARRTCALAYAVALRKPVGWSRPAVTSWAGSLGDLRWLHQDPGAVLDGTSLMGAGHPPARAARGSVASRDPPRQRHSRRRPRGWEETLGRWQRFRPELFNESTSYTHNYKRIRIDKNIFFP